MPDLDQLVTETQPLAASPQGWRATATANGVQLLADAQEYEKADDGVLALLDEAGEAWVVPTDVDLAGTPRPPSGAAGGALAGSYPNPGLSAPEAWREVGAAGQPAFQNSWVNYGSGFETAAFYKDPLGMVRLKGLVKLGSAIATDIFTLPEGYRPAVRLIAAVMSNDVAARLDVHPTGTVRPVTGSTAYVSLSGITFRAA